MFNDLALGDPAWRPPPIEDHGLIGDTRTAALVASDGSVNWLCVPTFDGLPVFGRLIGGPAAGTFRVGPAGPSTLLTRRYRGDSATLETTWDTGAARLTLTEGMVAAIAGRLLPSTLLVRRLEATGAPAEASIEFSPRLGEQHRPPRTDRRGDVLVCQWPETAVALWAAPHVAVEPGRPVTVTVTPERPLTLTVCVAHREPIIYVPPEVAWSLLEADEQRWQRWCEGLGDGLPHRDAVRRSLLTLQLLTYSPSGAPVAAPTTSLPEEPGGVRNWDYRYAWPRDASIGVGAFLGVGRHREARQFMAWLLSATRLDRPRVRVLLTLFGKPPVPEHELEGWPGYEGSRPVRVGNAAADQHQLDGYGWVLDAAWLLTNAGHPLNGETWRVMAGFADAVANRWREPDAGIWEVRSAPAHHVHSKLMAWLCLNRALRIAETRRTSRRRVARWHAECDAIAADVSSRGYDPQRRTFVRAYGRSDLDAAVLVLPLVGIVPPEDERVHGTIDAIRRELDAGGGLLYRYPPGRDGLPGTEGAFVPCAFWLVQALAHSGRTGEAAELFDSLIALASPLGLFAEELDPVDHRHLGNFPQALSHAALVQAALALRDRRLA